MITKRVCLMLTVFFLLLSGCSTTKTWVSSPETQRAENPFYTISITPLTSDAGVFNSFRLEFVNKSAAELEIDWNQSRYLYNGKKSGPFVFAGIEPSDVRNASVKPDLVPTDGSLIKTIAPYRLIARAPNRENRLDAAKQNFYFGPIPAGPSGVHIVVRQDGQEITEMLTVTIQETER